MGEDLRACERTRESEKRYYGYHNVIEGTVGHGECEKRIARLCGKLDYHRFIGVGIGVGLWKIRGIFIQSEDICPEFFDAGAYDYAGDQHRQIVTGSFSGIGGSAFDRSIPRGH